MVKQIKLNFLSIDPSLECLIGQIQILKPPQVAATNQKLDHAWSRE